MKKLYGKLFRTAFLCTASIVVLPQILLAPFGIITGFLTIDEFMAIAATPTVPGIILINIAVIGIVSFSAIRKIKKIESPSYDQLREMGLKIVALFFIYIIIEIIITLLTLTILAPISIEHRVLYAALFGGAFIIVACYPLSSIIVTRFERIVVAELPDEEHIFLPISMKIASLVGAVFTATIVLFVTLQLVMTSAVNMGRALPWGPAAPFYIAGGVCMFVIAQVLLIILGFVTKPVNSMSSSFNAASSGDFSASVQVHTLDEIGRISAQTNQLTTSLSQSFHSFNKSVNGIEEAKNSLSAGVEEISSAIEQINQNLESTNFQMEDHSAHINETTAAVEQLAKNIEALGGNITTQTALVSDSDSAVDNLLKANNQLDSLAETGLKRTDSLVGVSNQGKDKITSMAGMISEIMESSQHLSEANSLIAAVSSQTNLLAMNAAIEAAHAGEAGKGFAVVADEIRKLAETSSNQSKNINSNLKNLLSQIENVGSESHEVQQAFGLISNHVNDVRGAVESINEFTSSIREVSQEIRDALQLMGAVSVSISTGSDEMQQGNVEILQAVTNMRNINQKVAESVSEITVGSAEIRDMSVHMLEQNRITDDAITNFRDMLSKYKLKDIDS